MINLQAEYLRINLKGVTSREMPSLDQKDMLDYNLTTIGSEMLKARIALILATAGIWSHKAVQMFCKTRSS